MAKKRRKKTARKKTAGSIMGASSYKTWSKQIGPLKPKRKRKK